MNWSIAPWTGRSLSRLSEDPFASLHRELNRIFDDNVRGFPPSTAAAMSLRMDVKEDDKAFHVTADLPGMNEADVNVTFDNNMLTIRGEKKVERDEKQDTWHVIERSQGSFARQITLPTNIDANRISAKFEKGVLTVTLPKQAEEQIKAKKIEIKGA